MSTWNFEIKCLKCDKDTGWVFPTTDARRILIKCIDCNVEQYLIL